MELILWRHAEAEEGQPDLERKLTAKGRRQAQHVAAWLLQRLPSKFTLLSSPAVRARQTAEGIGYEPEVLPDLIEIDRGHWEGHEADEIQRRWGKLHKQWYDDPTGLAMPGGEAFDDLWARAGRVARRLEQEPGATILAAAHKAMNRVLVAVMTGLPSKGVWQIPQPQACCNVLVRTDDGWKATRVGDVSHLPPELRSSS